MGCLSWEYSGSDGSYKLYAKNSGNTKQSNNDTSTKFPINSLDRFGENIFQVMFYQVGVIRYSRYKDVANGGNEHQYIHCVIFSYYWPGSC